jgi:hypothetical protein
MKFQGTIGNVKRRFNPVTDIDTAPSITSIVTPYPTMASRVFLAALLITPHVLGLVVPDGAHHAVVAREESLLASVRASP